MPKAYVLLLEILLCLGVLSWDFALVLHYAYTIYPLSTARTDIGS